MYRLKPLLIILLVFASVGFLRKTANSQGFSTTVDGGRGLMNMQTARTFGKGAVVIGAKGLVIQRITPVRDASGTLIDTEDLTAVFGMPVTFGLTDEIDVTASFYGFYNARSWINESDVTRGYGALSQGVGASRFGVKIRLPFSMESRIQIAGRFDASLDTSDRMLEGLNYSWTRKGTDIEASLYESFDLASYMSLHLQQGYVLSGSQIYDDQYIGAVGVSFNIKDRAALNFEINNRTFMGVSPQSVLRAITDPTMYGGSGGLSSAINPSLVIDSDTDYDKDYLMFTPSLAVRVTDTVSLDFGANINMADHVEPMETVQAVIGITFTGRIKAMIDTDGDGIRNNVDIEPDTPRGYSVDDRGRAVDSDNDSVPDDADKEMNTPLGAKVNESGIGIDSDDDGIYDGIDMEPMTPKGCPVDAFGVALDDDRDGVPDGFDREPMTQLGAVVDADGRAIDSDGDGVPDGIDLEPESPRGAIVDRDGRVLDEDSDGVPDGIDEEPTTPKGLLVDKVGRALIREEFSLLREGVIRLNTVYFTLGNSVLAPESYPVLDDIGRLLLKYSSLNIQIEGHTDSSGDAAINMRLARERAQVVLEYILERFPDIDHTRFRVVGFGSQKPIAPNNTSEGRKLNRRVEFVVINQSELMKFNPAK